jgi:hypothetical protein
MKMIIGKMIDNNNDDDGNGNNIYNINDDG